MPDSQGNRRIAKNTLIVYGNMFLCALIGLYTSRLILDTLGVSDFGLFNVVGGIVGLFTFIFGSLSATTIRYINVEMGKEQGDVNKVFNVCLAIHVGVALLILLLAEIGGIYYIHHYLKVDPGKEADAMFIFQVTIIASCIGITNVPYSSLFNAHENFIFGTIVGLGTKLLQLGLIVWLVFYNGNKVRAYSLMMTLSSMLSMFITYVYCRNYWPDIIKLRLVKDRNLYKEALVFNNYNILSTLALMGRTQGSSLLINFFFGTTVNGAFGVAKSVESYVLGLGSNFDGASSPQITQNYSAGNMERTTYLVCKIGKYCIFIMMLAFFPLIAEMDFVLNLWLKEVPEGALAFCNMTLLVAFVASTGGGIIPLINASGKIGKFKITFSTLMILCIPLGYWLFKKGAPAYWLIGLFAAVDAIWRVIQLFYLKRDLHFSSTTYVKESYWPALKIVAAMTAVIVSTSPLPFDSMAWHACRFVFVFAATVLSIAFIGLTRQERYRVITSIKERFIR